MQEAVRTVVVPGEHDQFEETSWFGVMPGQGVLPEDYDPLADNISDAELVEHLRRVGERIGAVAHAMPTHEAYIAANCPAPVPA